MEYRPFLIVPRSRLPSPKGCRFRIYAKAAWSAQRGRLPMRRSMPCEPEMIPLANDVSMTTSSLTAVGESNWPAKCITFVGTGRWVQEQETGDELDRFRPHFRAPTRRAHRFHP